MIAPLWLRWPGARPEKSILVSGKFSPEGFLERCYSVEGLSLAVRVHEAVRLIADVEIPLLLRAHLFGLLLSPSSCCLICRVGFMVFFLVLCCSSCPSPFACRRPPAGAASGRVPRKVATPGPPAEQRSVEGDGRDEQQIQKRPEQLNNTTTDRGSDRSKANPGPNHRARARANFAPGSLGSFCQP